MLHNAAFMSDVTLRFRKGTHPPGLFISIYILARRGASVKMQRFHVSFVGQTFRNRRPLWPRKRTTSKESGFLIDFCI